MAKKIQYEGAHKTGVVVKDNFKKSFRKKLAFFLGLRYTSKCRKAI